MGLGSSFAVLVVAEMLGVKSGLGWYLQWAQGWAAYANMYGALLVMALMCSAPDHAAVPRARQAARLAEGNRPMVALATRDAAAETVFGAASTSATSTTASSCMASLCRC